MSSLAAARADNFYYPKEWRPEDGSLNTFHGSHALGKRAKRLASDGVLVVRFEMPFHVWCLHCSCHIGRGVRYNARKKQVGKYFTTPLYEFRMNCAQCKGELVVQTDPAHRGYAMISGLKKQSKREDQAYHQEDEEDEEEATTEQLNDPSVGLQVAADPFFKLEHAQQDKKKAAARHKGLEAVVALQESQFKDDYASNAALRASFRSKKRHLQTNAARAETLGLGITFVDATEEDVALAKATVFQSIPGKKRRVDSSSGNKVSVKPPDDTFKFFGDAKASQLHLLKMKKQHERRDRTTRSKNLTTLSAIVPTPIRKSSENRVMAKAKRLRLQQNR